MSERVREKVTDVGAMALVMYGLEKTHNFVERMQRLQCMPWMEVYTCSECTWVLERLMQELGTLDS